MSNKGDIQNMQGRGACRTGLKTTVLEDYSEVYIIPTIFIQVIETFEPMSILFKSEETYVNTVPRKHCGNSYFIRKLYKVYIVSQSHPSLVYRPTFFSFRQLLDNVL